MTAADLAALEALALAARPGPWTSGHGSDAGVAAVFAHGPPAVADWVEEPDAAFIAAANPAAVLALIAEVRRAREFTAALGETIPPITDEWLDAIHRQALTGGTLQALVAEVRRQRAKLAAAERRADMLGQELAMLTTAKKEP